MANLFGDQHLFWIKEKLRKCNAEPRAVYQNLFITLRGNLILLYKIVKTILAQTLMLALPMQTSLQGDMNLSYGMHQNKVSVE